MRQLHVVAVTSDGKSLLLAGAVKGARATHKLAIDKKLHAALAGDLYADSPNGDTPRQESALSPREMQARLRAGETVEQVAAAAGVSVDRIERYAGPVESERQQVIEAARAVIVERPRWGPSARSLGDSVTANLAFVSALRPETVDWSTRRRPDNCWVVRLEFIARGRRRVAEWEWEPHERAATPLDQFAAGLGYVEPRSRARARASAARSKAAAPRRTTKKATTRKAAAGSATRRKATAKKAGTKVAKKAATKRATGGRRTQRRR